ncbi:MAG: hypothetical protein AB8H79_11340 [Myxococcota bacterium]
MTMRAFVRIQVPDGTIHELEPGDLIGRLWTSALCVSDARVSEAHAMVSLRGQELKLLALRGRFATARKPLTELTLCAGQQVHLAPGVTIQVLDVELPEAVMALESEGWRGGILAGVCSLVVEPEPTLVPKYNADADAVFWSTGSGWWARLGDEERPVGEGDTLTCGGRSFTLVAMPLSRTAQATRLGSGVRAPIRLVNRFDTVHLHREGEPAVVLTGLSARIVSELAMVGSPVEWEPVARILWGDGDTFQLRNKWDAALSRLRRKLRNKAVRSDLIRADGLGCFELVLYPDDTLVDAT